MLAALLVQMRADAPVTFLPALHVYAVTRWQEVHDVLGDAVTAIITLDISNFSNIFAA